MHPRLSILFNRIAWALIADCSDRYSSQPQEAPKKPEARPAFTSMPPTLVEEKKVDRDTNEDKPTLRSIPTTGIIRISADDLLAHFRADGDTAHRVSSDRTVEVSDKVVHAYRTKAGKPVVTFGEVGRVLSRHVECYFQPSENPKVLEGQTCIIRGRCMGKSMAVSTCLQECIVLSAP